ncbi:MAG: undecaprenyl-phosphate glucose phosphotransferase [Alphaproteobacteria bacterium]|nr:undecaprenyl-phosphate glucose phosphotransferase [Alphaproteobacteria bacterium]
MEAFGGTSAHKAPRTRWYEPQDAFVQLSSETAKPSRTSAFLRRLASLNAGQIVSDLFFAFESCMICVFGIVAAALFMEGPLTLVALMQPAGAPLFLVPMALAFLFKYRGLYQFEHLATFSGSITQVFLFACLAFCLAILGSYAAGIGDEHTSIWLATWMLCSLTGLAVLRASASWICGRLMEVGAVHQSVAVFGDKAAAQSACQSLAQSSELIRLDGVFGPFSDRASGTGQPFKGDLDALIEGALGNAFDTIVIATDRVSNDDIRDLLARLENLPCAVQIYFTFKNETAHRQQGQAVSLFEVQAKPISGWGRLSKRFLDVTLAALGLVALAPLLLLIAAAIKLDSPGPVFFTQRRHGLNRRVFRIFKLRTMTVMEEGDSAVQATRQDVRVTRIGALLRKTSVDELPQLLNVLKGEMSLVGPRPHPLSLDDHYAGRLDIYSSRHKVKPGITGWAQINGHRGPTDQPGLMQRRVQHDLEYIDNWSLWLDVKIIAATPFLGVIHKNAV